MGFPEIRMRRLRRTPGLRNMVRETSLSRADLILPLFVCPGSGIKNEISSMPGNYHMSVDVLAEECKAVEQLGIPGVILFGLPEFKDDKGSSSWSDQGIVQQAVKAIKKETASLIVIADICLCEYTSHGHCGVIQNREVDNDPTLELLARQAVSLARAGVDMVAPSDMMDGRVAFIRRELDRNGFQDLPIMSYAVKYASAFYGPFREAAESAPQFGDRRSYQMDPANSREALREARLDAEEGADIIMVKPALAYLDIIFRLRQEIDLPIAAYNVSGEFSCLKAAAQKNWIDEEKAMIEVAYSIKRAGADIILTYFAKDLVSILERKGI